MDLPDFQSCNEDDSADTRSDESSGTCPEPDAVMEEVQEGPSPMKIDIDQAVDLMRFAFREGISFLDNGSGRSFEERILLDMSDFMVNLLLGGPGVPRRRNGPCRMREITPTLDKDIACAFAKETRKGVASEISLVLFKRYMVLFARYLNDKGEVMERLVGVVPEPDVYDSALNVTVHSMLSEAGLNLSNVQGQGYGLAFYSDEIFNDLKASVTKESASAYCVHPYAFHLNSTIAYTSQKQVEVFELFQAVDKFSDRVQGSPEFREKLCSLMEERGLHLESDLEKPGETCWGSYYEALVKLAAYLPHVCDVLDFMGTHASKTDERNMACRVQWAITDEFPFVLLLMRDVLGATNELSLALHRSDLDAENCMVLLQESKKQLLVMRDEGWPSFLNKVDLLCIASDMPIPDMAEQFIPRLRLSYPEPAEMTNLEHYHVDVYIKVINDQLGELDKRFSKESSELVRFSSYLNPRNLFQAFDKDRLIEFARLYPSEFPDNALAMLDLQLQAFITDVRSDARFGEMNVLSDLSVKMVETGKNAIYPLVYMLLKLLTDVPGA